MSEIIKKSIFVKLDTKYQIFFHVKSNSYNYYYETSEGLILLGSEFQSKINDAIQNVDVIKTIDLPIPFLNVGDEFFFEEEKQVVTIIKVIRTSNDNVMYVVNTSNTIDEESLQIYKKDKKKYLNMNSLISENKKLQSLLTQKEEEIEFLKKRTVLQRLFNKLFN